MVDDYERHSLIARRCLGLRLNDGLFIKFQPVGWGLMIRLWLGPPWFNSQLGLAVDFGLAKSIFLCFTCIIVINLIFMSSLWCID